MLFHIGFCRIIAVLDSSIVSDLASSDCSKTSQCSLVEDILDDHLALPRVTRGRPDQGATNRGNNSQSSSKERSKSSSVTSKKQHAYSASSGLSTTVKSSEKSSSIKHSLLTDDVDEHDQALVNSIAMLEVDESVRRDLMKNLNLAGIKPTISIEAPKPKSHRKRSGSLDSHGSGSTDSILNEAEEQIRMTTSGLDLVELGLSTGNLCFPTTPKLSTEHIDTKSYGKQDINVSQSYILSIKCMNSGFQRLSQSL